MTLRTIGTTSAVALTLMLLASGCVLRARGRAGVTGPPPPNATVSVQANTPPPPSGNFTVQVGQPTVQAGVTVVESTCTQGAAEVCNGLDDNCNGQIDEGCGYQSGNIQITLAWNTGADIDMYVTDPAGETVSYGHVQSNSGGHLDHDARGQCRPSQENNRIENVFWDNAQPPSGTYQIELHYWGECNSNAGPTTTTLSIAVGGSIVGAYNYTLAPNQRVSVASFNIP